MSYLLLLLFKFLGICLFAGGLIANFVSSTLADRKKAVHRVASPGLLLIWITGTLLCYQLNIPLTELWIVAGFAFSLVSQLALVHSVAKDSRGRGVQMAAGVPFLLCLVLMVFRLSWASLGL